MPIIQLAKPRDMFPLATVSDAYYSWWLRRRMADPKIPDNIKTYVYDMWFMKYFLPARRGLVTGWKTIPLVDPERVERPIYVSTVFTEPFDVMRLHGTRIAVDECMLWNKTWTVEEAVEIFRESVWSDIQKGILNIHPGRLNTYAERHRTWRTYRHYAIMIPEIPYGKSVEGAPHPYVLGPFVGGRIVRNIPAGPFPIVPQ